MSLLVVMDGNGAKQNVATDDVVRDSGTTEKVQHSSFAATQSLANRQVTVSTTAIQITSLTPAASLLLVRVKNNGATDDAVVGGSNAVTVAGATGGMPISPGTYMDFPIGKELALWCIAAVGTLVSVMEFA